MQKKKKMNLDRGLILFAKINSKWILGLNVKHKTVKCFGDNTEEILDDLGNGDVFLDNTNSMTHGRNN